MDIHLQWVWEGASIHHQLQDHQTHDCRTDTLLAEELNWFFFARYEVKAVETNMSPPPASNSHMVTVQEHDVGQLHLTER